MARPCHARGTPTARPWHATLTREHGGVAPLAAQAAHAEESAPEVLPGHAVEHEVDAEVGVEQDVEVVLQDDDANVVALNGLQQQGHRYGCCINNTSTAEST